MLALIENKNIQPSAVSAEKMSKVHFHQKENHQNNHESIDRFWEQRYLIFERFDEGFLLDEDSWEFVVPDAIAEYISNKIRCETVLDGFCGVGEVALKLSNTCSRVVAVDSDSRKLRCLDNNEKIFCSNENI